MADMPREDSAKRAMKSANKKLCRSTWHENPIIWYKYNEYMAHHYAYMAKVVEVCELESYAKAAKDANWRATMDEEMAP